MKALVYDGELSVREVPDPHPVEGECLIQVLYSAICHTDLEIIKGYMGFHGVLGHEFVGRVVTRESEFYGQVVTGEINCPCGHCYLCQTGRPTHCPHRTVLGISGRQGVFAEFLVLPSKNLHLIPAPVDPVEAVFTEPLAAAYEIFEGTAIKPTNRTFIFGAGKLGLLIAQVFRLSAVDYTLFDLQRQKIDIARSLGLHADYLSVLQPHDKAEVCVDCTGNPDGIRVALSHLYSRGNLILKTTVANPSPIDLNQLVIHEFSVTGSRCGPFEPAIRALSQKLVHVRPLITKQMDFADILDGFTLAKQPDVLKIIFKHSD